MNIIHKSRHQDLPCRAQRVFFCFDMSNVSEKSSLIDDLLSDDAGMDCVVSYRETTDIDKGLLVDELKGYQALVIWITDELLQSRIDNGRFPEEYYIAKTRHIPILPIAKNSRLFERLTELAGAIHGIAMDDSGYRRKLKDQLSNFLVSEEIIKEIQEKAFTSTVFLSYRKKDINEAYIFMKTFHDLKDFEAVSIWYDNNLTAGRIFEEEIRNAIINCDAFVLLITPHILEKNAEGKDNYVVSTEYPFARAIDKLIIPIEVTPTDLSGLKKLFPGIKNVINMEKESTAIETIFRKKKLLKYPYLLSFEKGNLDYLLGMAYQKGIGVEVDFDRARRLLK